jgi:hypothetical protein
MASWKDNLTDEQLVVKLLINKVGYENNSLFFVKNLVVSIILFIFDITKHKRHGK